MQVSDLEYMKAKQGDAFSDDDSDSDEEGSRTSVNSPAGAHESDESHEDPTSRSIQEGDDEGGEDDHSNDDEEEDQDELEPEDKDEKKLRQEADAIGNLFDMRPPHVWIPAFGPSRLQPHRAYPNEKYQSVSNIVCLNIMIEHLVFPIFLPQDRLADCFFATYPIV